MTSPAAGASRLSHLCRLCHQRTRLTLSLTQPTTELRFTP